MNQPPHPSDGSAAEGRGPVPRPPASGGQRSEQPAQPGPPNQPAMPGRPSQPGQLNQPNQPNQPRQPPAEFAQPGPHDGRPRLTPRPLERPPVEPAEAATFGRPPGLAGAFAPRHERWPGNGSPLLAPPRVESLATAFGRPAGTDTVLQRPPGHQPLGTDREDEAHFWADDAERDPWRNPASPALLGPPAVREEPDEDAPERAEGARLSIREVLFGRRVSPRALGLLAVLALLIGAAGGLVGRLTAEGANPLTRPDVTIVQAETARDRPPGSVAEVAGRVLPAVVSIEIRVGENGGTGSGVVINGDGYIVTNNHVISLAATNPGSTLEVIFSDGTRVGASIVGRDPKTDLAVIKVDVANPVVATLGRSSDLKVGDSVIAIGSPLGLAGTVTTGIVSAVDRPVRLDGEGTDTNAVIDAIQTDAAINPGNSGGALVDGGGAVVGINTAIRTLSQGGAGGSIGLGFAIPIDDATAIAQELIRTGQVKHPELGVNAKSVTDGTTDGAQVQNVQQDSAAAQAGIADGDVITKIGDRLIGSADELIVAVRERQIGEQVAVTLVRQGRPLVVQVVLKSD
jgi:serine protease Do